MPCQCVCVTQEQGALRGLGRGRVTELMQRHKQEMTLFGERVSLWVGTSSNYPPFSAELTSNYCYSLIKVCKLNISFFFFSPDWVKYHYSQLTKVLNIILVHPWKGSVTKRKPNKKSSEPGQTWVRVYKTCSERVPPQALGVPTISHHVCCLSFDECTYPLVLLLKLGDGVDWACKSVPQVMGQITCFL